MLIEIIDIPMLRKLSDALQGIKRSTALPVSMHFLPLQDTVHCQGAGCHLNSSSVSSVNFAVLLSASLVAAPLKSAAPLLLDALASSASVGHGCEAEAAEHCLTDPAH